MRFLFPAASANFELKGVFKEKIFITDPVYLLGHLAVSASPMHVTPYKHLLTRNVQGTGALILAISDEVWYQESSIHHPSSVWVTNVFAEMPL